MALITSASVARVRGSFLSFNSSIQQLALGLATFLSGQIVGQDALGRLTHYGTVGWLAAGITLGSLGLAYRLSSAKNEANLMT